MAVGHCGAGASEDGALGNGLDEGQTSEPREVARQSQMGYMSVGPSDNELQYTGSCNAYRNLHVTR